MDNNENMAPKTEVKAAAEPKTDKTDKTERTETTEKRQYRQPQKRRKKVCVFCQDKISYIDYKDTARLRKFVSPERSKLLPRRVTGTCAKHQRQLTLAIKRSRQMALMPYISD